MSEVAKVQDSVTQGSRVQNLHRLQQKHYRQGERRKPPFKIHF